MFIASDKNPEREGSSHHADFMGNCSTVSQTCLLYLSRSYVFLFLLLVA